MPGEIVTFAGGADAVRLVSALHRLSANDVSEFVLVGGLAVAARLKIFHRATQDLDALTGDDRGQFSARALEIIPGAILRDANLFVGDVRVDIINVDPKSPYKAIAELDDPLDRLFNSAHLFAHSDASPMILRSGEIEASVPVASARSLLITKLHAYSNPHRDRRKHPSDALDIFRLGTQLVGEASRPLADQSVPREVRAIAGWGVERIRKQPEDMTRRLAVIGATATKEQVEALADLMLEDLTD